ncbi:hypothetical protein BKA56DRAFT_613100 [Ilyonectria sp. MPI-CAGE-AT-0026]|nr:hypothetical protein BKA56DRAFT_613100 [Ilyonectria sp. MPI-CAGE-AT-0026]
MPQSLDQPQSRANPSQEASQIATSNQTVNAFIGGRHHSWMTDAAPTTSNLIRVSEVVPRKRGRPRKEHAPLGAPSANDGNAGPRENTPIIPRLDQPAVLDASRNQAVLPSPAPTDEPSPVISSQTDSPNQGLSGYADNTIPPQRAVPEYNSRVSMAPTPNTAPTVPTSMPTAGSSSQTYAAPPSGPITQTVIERAMASASGVNASPRQEPAPGPSMAAGVHISSPQTSQRTAPDSGSAERRRKRMRIGRDDPVTQALKDWLRVLSTHMEQFNGPRLLNETVEIPRYRILRDACANADVFYVVLHQLFCGWSRDRPFVHSLLASHISFEAVDHAFGYMQVILRQNQLISPPHLEWLTNFPGPLAEISRSSPQCMLVNVVARFLHQLSATWEPMMALAESRKFPLLVSEMVHNLSCTSSQMQSLLFTTSRRTLRVEDGPLATSLNEIFAKDRASEAQIAAAPRSAEEVRQIRGGFATAYVNTMQLFRYQQPPNQNAAPSPTLPSFPPSVQRHGAHLSAHPSPILSHPHFTLPSNSGAPSPVITQAEAHMASRRASGPAVLGSSAPRANTHVQNASSWAQRTPESMMNQAPQNFVNSPSQIHQPLTPGSAGTMPPYPYPASYAAQGVPPSRVVSSNGPAQNSQRRTSSFQQQSTQAGPIAQGTTAHNGQTSGLQFPQYVLQPPNMQPMSQGQVNSGQPNQGWPSQYPNAARSWPQVAPVHGGYAAQATAPQHQTQRALPPIQPASSHPPAPYPYPVPQSPGLVRPLGEMEIHPNEYAVSPYGQPSLEMGLHHVSLRSPRRLHAQLVQTRYYQYVKHLEIQPVAIEPQIGLRTLRFDVPENHIPRLTMKRESAGLPFCHYFEGSYRYRLRLCMRPDWEIEVEAADWAVSACYWPKHVFIDVNGHVMGLSRKQHFHKDLPLELTDILVLGPNTIRISLPLVAENNARVGHKYFVAIELVETRSHGSLRAMIENFQHTSMDETRNKLIRRLRPSASDDIIVEDETLLVSLADPFSASMVEIPVRGVDCLHLECFDLETWLQTRPSKPAQKGGGSSQNGEEPSMVDVWKCPICDLDARPMSLRIDDYFVQVRHELVARGETNTKAITVAADGKWTAVEEPDDSDDETPAPIQARVTNGDGGKKKSTPTASVIEILDD